MSSNYDQNASVFGIYKQKEGKNYDFSENEQLCV